MKTEPRGGPLWALFFVAEVGGGGRVAERKKRLTKRQERFCEEYMIDLNGTQAAIRAGYSPDSAAQIAYENMRKPEIRARIETMQAERSKRTGINQDRVLREIAAVAFASGGDIIDFETGKIRKNLSEEDRAAIVGMKIKYSPYADGGIVEQEIKLAPKMDALQMLGDHLGIFDGKGKADVETNLLEILSAGAGVSKDDIPEI